MGAEENKALARRFYDVFNRDALDELDEIVSPVFVDHDPVPGQGPGIEGLKQALVPFRTGFPDIRVEVEDVIAEGDRVALRLIARGTHSGDFFGVPATGKRIELKALDLYRVTNGKLAEAWHVEDVFGLMVQLGVIPPPGG